MDYGKALAVAMAIRKKSWHTIAKLLGPEDAQRAVLGCLKPGPVKVDQLLRLLQLTPSDYDFLATEAVDLEGMAGPEKFHRAFRLIEILASGEQPRLVESSTEPRQSGCACQWEPEGSPCTVHGLNEEDTWWVHVVGPDDMYPCATLAQALALQSDFNATALQLQWNKVIPFQTYAYANIVSPSAVAGKARLWDLAVAEASVSPSGFAAPATEPSASKWLVRGIVMAAAHLAARGEATLADELLRMNGVTHTELNRSGIDQIELAALRPLLASKRSERSCRICGCTDWDCRGCVERTGHPCRWVKADLCSACSTRARRRAVVDQVATELEVRLTGSGSTGGRD